MRMWPALFLALAVIISACVAPGAPAPAPNVTPTPAGPTATATAKILSPPASIIINQPLKLTWTVQSTAASVRTEIRYSLDPVTGYNYGLSTNTQAGAPGTFTAEFTTSRVGKVYARAHVTVNGQDFWSDEVVIDVLPVPATVKVITFPQTVSQGAEAEINWTVTGGLAGDISQAIVRWGYASGNKVADYPVLSASQTGKTPAAFVTKIKLTRIGTTFLRAFATVDGTEYKSDEFVITATGGY